MTNRRNIRYKVQLSAKDDELRDLRAERDRAWQMVSWVLRDLAMNLDSGDEAEARLILHHYQQREVRGPLCDMVPAPTAETEARP